MWQKIVQLIVVLIVASQAIVHMLGMIIGFGEKLQPDPQLESNVYNTFRWLFVSDFALFVLVTLVVLFSNVRRKSVLMFIATICISQIAYAAFAYQTYGGFAVGHIQQAVFYQIFYAAVCAALSYYLVIVATKKVSSAK